MSSNGPTIEFFWLKIDVSLFFYSALPIFSAPHSSTMKVIRWEWFGKLFTGDLGRFTATIDRRGRLDWIDFDRCDAVRQRDIGKRILIILERCWSLVCFLVWHPITLYLLCACSVHLSATFNLQNRYVCQCNDDKLLLWATNDGSSGAVASQRNMKNCWKRAYSCSCLTSLLPLLMLVLRLRWFFYFDVGDFDDWSKRLMRVGCSTTSKQSLTHTSPLCAPSSGNQATLCKKLVRLALPFLFDRITRLCWAASPWGSDGGSKSQWTFLPLILFSRIRSLSSKKLFKSFPMPRNWREHDIIFQKKEKNMEITTIVDLAAKPAQPQVGCKRQFFRQVEPVKMDIKRRPNWFIKVLSRPPRLHPLATTLSGIQRNRTQ